MKGGFLKEGAQTHNNREARKSQGISTDTVTVNRSSAVRRNWTVPGLRVKVNGKEREVPLFNISFVYWWMCLMGLAMTGPNRAALADWGSLWESHQAAFSKVRPPTEASSQLPCPDWT